MGDNLIFGNLILKLKMNRVCYLFSLKINTSSPDLETEG